jgi:UDP-GlcNAc:undecaprenyl-phosphate/decaprenyl-phosphate GlcNAc-1-phosphate transferase
MREYLMVMALAGAITFFLTPYVRTLALRSGAYLEIRSRDLHEAITPRWGGLAMWLGMIITIFIVRNLPLIGKSYDREFQGIILASAVIVALGAIDDVFEIDSITKFAGQALAAGILLIYGVQILWIPFNGIITLPTNLGALLTVIFVMVVMNAVNFVDGLDALATGIVAIMAGSFFAYSYLLAVVNGFSRAGSPSLISALVFGVCVGFFPYNYHPARIFMGDSGAMLLGLLLAASAITLTGQIDTGAINSGHGATFLPLALPIMVLAIPLLDLGMAIVRRLRAGKSPFSSDSQHLHHRLLLAGNSHRRTSIILYLWSAIFAIPAVVTAFLPFWVALLTALVLFSVAIVLMLSGKASSLKYQKLKE